MTTLASLLSGASLEVVVPSSSDHAAPPPSNLVHNSAVGPQAVDEWARELLKAAPRPSLYRDEVVNVYLALSIADPENNLAQQDLASALARARQEGHLISQLELQLDGASSTAARPQRTGSLAFPAFRVDTASYTIAPGGSTADTSASEGALKSEQWWLARVEARYVLLWHFAGRPRGMHGVRETKAALRGCVRLSHDCPLSETASSAQDDVYMDEEVFDDYSISIPAYSTTDQHRSNTADPASSRPERADSSLLPTPLLQTAELTLPVISPLSVDMRVIPSPLGDGAILAIDIASIGEACNIVGLQVRVDARANHSPGAAGIPPIEARPYGATGGRDLQHLPDADRPLHLAVRDRFARLFSLRASALASEGPGDGPASSRDLEPLPIEVMSSPSQQFNSRFGDEVESNKHRAAHQRMVSTSSTEPPYRITVTVSVRMQSLSASVICSEWQHDLDSASIARDAPRPLTATFPGGSSLPPILPRRQHPSTISSNLPPSPHAAAIALISARAAAPSQARHARASADTTACQAYAGSYQYTRKGLASSSSSATAAADGVFSDARTAPRPTSVSATVAAPQARRPSFAGSASLGPSTLAATGPKRFFSLPPAASASTASMPSIPNPPPTIRTGDLPPNSASKSSSLPFTSAAAEAPVRPTNAHRKSWMSGLVSKSPAPSSENLPMSHGETQAADPQPFARSDSISVPPNVGTSWDMEPDPTRTPRVGLNDVAAKDHGKVVVSVSLVPLRKAKSRRSPPALNTSSASTLNAPTGGESSSPSPTSPFPPHRIATVPPPPHSPTRSSPAGCITGVSNAVELSPNTAASAVIGARDPSPPKLHQSPQVNVLDIFLVDVFVLNQTNTVKHYLVRAPPAGRGEPCAGSLGVVPLETDIEIGPLAPDSCAACALRFLALRSGSHEIERIQLVDLAEGTEMVLEKPVIVVVE
ncbi:hypothetical protein RHOSPDRAFT_33293 [Rhodotorula sp. JG-1b]|nr:hypothetical protein RHOSPDRAFT_33293 [Rhodotorula sp. JG-1b]